MSIAIILAAAYSAAIALSNVTGNGVTPIQITTVAPHGYGTGDWVQVSGVQGNTAANVADKVTVIDAHNFTVPHTGNGAWTSGTGIVAGYYGIANGLALMGHAPLTNNAVNVGPEFLSENQSFPLITFVPTIVPFVGRSDFNSGPDVTIPPLRGRQVTGEVHCWGSTYDDAMVLGDQFIRSMMYVLTSGNFNLGRGKFTDTTRIAVSGREFVFDCSWIEPVTATPVTLVTGITTTADIFLDGGGNATGTTPVVIVS